MISFAVAPILAGLRASLGSVGTNVALGLGVAALAGVILTATYQAGKSGERARGEAASLRARLALAEIDAAVSRSIADAATRDRAAVDRQLAERNEVIDDYEKELAKRTDRAACRVGDRAKRVRSLAAGG